MRGKVLSLLMMVFVLSLWSIATLAQTEEQRAPLYIVEDTVVKPSKVAEYEEHVKMADELFAKYEYPYPVYAFSTEDFHYIFVFPVENFADMDNIYKATGEMAQKAGEEFQAMIKSAEGTLEYSTYFMVRYIPQLSYIPEKPRLKQEESNFILWECFYAQPTKEGEFAEVLKQWQTLYKNKDIPDGWELYVGSLGTEQPLFIAMFRAKSAADYFSQWEKTLELLGEEGQELLKKTVAPLRKFERKSGRYRPDLSYIPKKEKPTE